MSRPKTGSVTTPWPSGENGTWLVHSRTVSQADETDPPTIEGDEDRDRGQGHPGERRQVRQVAGIERSTAPGAGPERRRGAVPTGEPGRPPRPSAAWAASLSRSTKPAQRARAAGHRRRQPDDGRATRLPSRTTSGQRKRADEQAEGGGQPVQKTESKPTLAYHSASVHRSSPTPNRRTTQPG